MNTTWKPEAPKTIREAVTRGVVRAVLAIAAIAAFYGTMAGMAHLGQTAQAPAQVQADDSHAAAADLAEAHECWTGPAPKGVTIPGHAIVIKDGQARYAGSHKALAQVFDGADHGLTVFAFCR